MMINGVSVERDPETSRQVERFMDIGDDEDVAHLFEAVVRIDGRTGEFRLEHLRAELLPLD